MQKNHILILLLTVLPLLWAGCDFKREEVAPRSALHTFHIANQPIQAELALTISERQAGLKHRTELPQDQGMLFIFENPQKVSFWMRNTHIPLDIAYLTGDGIIREIHQMYPNVTVGVDSSRDDIVMALEMNEGWFASKGILPGDRIDLVEVRRAIQRRGDNPDIFPIQMRSSIR